MSLKKDIDEIWELEGTLVWAYGAFILGCILIGIQFGWYAAGGLACLILGWIVFSIVLVNAKEIQRSENEKKRNEQ